MNKKRLFQILDDMNLHDIENNSKLVMIGPDFIQGDTTKKGCKITMGAHIGAVNAIAKGDVIPILVLVDKKEYFKRESEK